MRFLLKNVSSIPSSSIVNDYNRTENAWAQRYERANLGDNQNDNKFTLQDFAQLNDSKQKNFIKDFLDPTKGRGNMQDILTLIMNDTSHYGSNNANLKEFVHTLLSDFRNELISFFNGEIAGNNSDGDRSRQLLQLIIRNANPNDLKSFINSTSDKDFLEKLINNDCDNKVHSVVEELITTGSRAQREKFENILSNTDSLSTDSLSNVGKLREWGLTKYNKVMDGSGTISRADLACLTSREKKELADALIKKLPNPQAEAMLKDLIEAGLLTGLTGKDKEGLACTLIKQLPDSGEMLKDWIEVGLLKGLDTASWDNVGAELLRKINDIDKHPEKYSLGGMTKENYIEQKILEPILKGMANGNYDKADLAMLYDNLCNNKVVLGVSNPEQLAGRYISTFLLETTKFSDGTAIEYRGVSEGNKSNNIRTIIGQGDDNKTFNQNLATARKTVNGRETTTRSNPAPAASSASRTVTAQEAQKNYEAFQTSSLWDQIQINVDNTITIPGHDDPISLPEGINVQEFKTMAILYLSATKDGATIGAPGSADLQKVANFMQELAEAFENWSDKSPTERASALEKAFIQLGIPEHGSDPDKLNWLDWQLFPPSGTPEHFLSNFLTTDDPAAIFEAMQGLEKPPHNELTNNSRSLLNKHNLVIRTGNPTEIARAETLAGNITSGKFSNPAYSSFIYNHGNNAAAVLRATAIYCVGREMPGLPKVTLGVNQPYTIVFNAGTENSFTMDVGKELYEQLEKLSGDSKYQDTHREYILTQGKLPDGTDAPDQLPLASGSSTDGDESEIDVNSTASSSQPSTPPLYYPLVLEGKTTTFGSVQSATIDVDNMYKLTSFGLNAREEIPCVRQITIAGEEEVSSISIGKINLSNGTYNQVAIPDYPGMTVLTSTGGSEGAKTYLVVAGKDGTLNEYELPSETEISEWIDLAGNEHRDITLSMVDGNVTIKENNSETMVSIDGAVKKTAVSPIVSAEPAAVTVLTTIDSLEDLINFPSQDSSSDPPEANSRQIQIESAITSGDVVIESGTYTQVACSEGRHILNKNDKSYLVERGEVKEITLSYEDEVESTGTFAVRINEAGNIVITDGRIITTINTQTNAITREPLEE